MDDSARTRGILMVTLAGVFWSLQGLTIRAVEEASASQIVFWRATAQLISLLALLAFFNKGQLVIAFRRAGWVGMVGGLCAFISGTSFVFGLMYTTVANVVFVLAAAPLFTAALAWLVMGERIRLRSIVIMLVALAGIGVMMGEGLVTGNILGNLFALASTLGFAGIAVVARWGGGLDMMPSAGWGAAFTAIFAGILVGGDVAISSHDLAACYVSGGVLTAVGVTCFFFGARYVPAGVLAFLSLTEVVLAPFWVWLGFDEVPSTLTLIGGAIVLSAIASEAWLRISD